MVVLGALDPVVTPVTPVVLVVGVPVTVPVPVDPEAVPVPVVLPTFWANAGRAGKISDPVSSRNAIFRGVIPPSILPVIMAHPRPGSCKWTHVADPPQVTMAAMNRFVSYSGCLAFCLLAACSTSPPAAENKAEPPPEPLTGLSALFRMYQVGRASWASDAQVIKMSSVRLSGVPTAPPGLSDVWEATFYSPSHVRARSYTDSIVEQLPDLHKDVFAGPLEDFRGESFPIAAVKKDTESAYQTALVKAGKDAERIAGKPVLILLEKDNRFPDPVWRILWGESVSTAIVSVFIDATTGGYLETVR